MKKKLLEKDGFYLALFVCICLVAIGGVWFTKNNVDELTSNDLFVNKTNDNSKIEEDEVHLIEKETEKEDSIPTSTESNENLQKAKEKQENKSSKLSFLGNEVVREYSEKEPSYSKTLDLWEIHKGLDISAEKGYEIKSLLNGKVVNVFKDDKHGMSVRVQSDNNVVVVYSNLDEKISVEKGQEVTEGQILGTVGNTTSVESEDGTHVHIEAFKGEESIDPMTFIK
ncbi:MAG TPA: M23 family metallopeptidase [Romboutsia timonensis]|uniref:M23 family metallopeptidase n=1 Tax=Romboutsia timonensis TaxID=1776391 RepID=A0A921N231_9FIRM|nr:M23 family metallopeptidase [uncultured Romboutsia sp.]HJG97502.1 M23 family metallopeptidase [Romboutsia timonensis]